MIMKKNDTITVYDFDTGVVLSNSEEIEERNDKTMELDSDLLVANNVVDEDVDSSETPAVAGSFAEIASLAHKAGHLLVDGNSEEAPEKELPRDEPVLLEEEDYDLLPDTSELVTSESESREAYEVSAGEEGSDLIDVTTCDEKGAEFLEINDGEEGAVSEQLHGSEEENNDDDEMNPPLSENSSDPGEYSSVINDSIIIEEDISVSCDNVPDVPEETLELLEEADLMIEEAELLPVETETVQAPEEERTKEDEEQEASGEVDIDELADMELPLEGDDELDAVDTESEITDFQLAETVGDENDFEDTFDDILDSIDNFEDEVQDDFGSLDSSDLIAAGPLSQDKPASLTEEKSIIVETQEADNREITAFISKHTGPLKRQGQIKNSPAPGLSKREQESIEEDIECEHSLVIEENVEDIKTRIFEYWESECKKCADISDDVVILEDDSDVERFLNTMGDLSSRPELRKLLKYFERLFEELPEDALKNFAESEYFDLYVNFMNQLEDKNE